MTRRLAGRAAAIAAVAGWLLFGYLTLTTVSGAASANGDVFQVDWHVYWAGADDLLGRELYRVPLEAQDLTLSTPHFNLPPFSAIWALPLLGVPISTGGSVWQAIGAASIAVAAIVSLDILRVSRPWLMAGMVLGPLALTLVYLEGLHVATNNYLVLGLAAGFAWLYLRAADAPAGALLGIAIATKLWPAVLLVPAVRERRWAVVGWATGIAVVQGVVLFGWLGVDAVPLFVEHLSTGIPPTGMLIGPAAVDGLRETWNSGLGLLVGVAILALPLRGPAAIGAAILAGMAAIPNLWIHYGTTVLCAVALVGGAMIRRRGDRHEPHERSDPRDEQEAIAGHENQRG
jgi:hypothetical protein